MSILTLFFSGFFIGIIGGTPDKRISEALFCLFLYYCLFIFFVLFIFSDVFISIIGGTPDKRITEGQKNMFFGFYRHYRGTPAKRIYEGLFLTGFVLLFFWGVCFF